MSIIKRIFIALLSIALLNCSVLRTAATDSNNNGSGTGTNAPSENGLMYAGGGQWIQGADGRWWYRHSDGSYTTSDWEYIDGKWYYFDADGWMVTGWLQLGNTWYYLLPSSGEMVTGWQYIGNKTYYFESSGAMVTGWKYIGNYWYYFNDDGTKAIGWKQVGNKWYYLDSDGHMLTGWHYLYYRDDVYDGNSYYNYFNSSGEFETDSDRMGCASGFNTYQDHINLNGTTLKYYIDTIHNYNSSIITAGVLWNTISEYSIYISQAYYQSDNHQILFVDNNENICPNVYAETFFFINDYRINPSSNGWDYNIIQLNPNMNIDSYVICHELGHALGLTHRITENHSIMYYGYNGISPITSPQQCDLNVVNHLY